MRVTTSLFCQVCSTIWKTVLQETQWCSNKASCLNVQMRSCGTVFVHCHLANQLCCQNHQTEMFQRIKLELTPAINRWIKRGLNSSPTAATVSLGHYLLDLKFKDFSMTFQDLLKEIQDLLLSTKTLMLCNTFFSNQTLLFSFTEMADPDNEKQEMTEVTLDKNQALQSCSFCFTALSYQKYFN